jgi:hypothetical protein
VTQSPEGKSFCGFCLPDIVELDMGQCRIVMGLLGADLGLVPPRRSDLLPEN